MMKRIIITIIFVISICTFGFAEGIVVIDDIKYYKNDADEFVYNAVVDINESIYYFGNDGKMQSNCWISTENVNVFDSELDGWFYFADNGKAVKADSGRVKKREIDGKIYYFDENGILLTGWFNENGDKFDPLDGDDWFSSDAMYYSNEDGVAQTGWLSHLNTLSGGEHKVGVSELDRDTLWFYFGKNNKKVGYDEAVTKKINGKTYRFQSGTGLMYENWEALEEEYESDSASSVGTKGEHNLRTGTKPKQYIDPKTGEIVKKAWIHIKPSKIIDYVENDVKEDEEWFYADGSGNIVVNEERKIDGKNYVFDRRGIMRKGLVLFSNGQFWCTVDLEKTTYNDFVKLYTFYPERVYDYDHDYLYNDTDLENLGEVYDDFYMMHEFHDNKFKIKYFNEDGVEQRGYNIKVNFADGEYDFAANQNGAICEWYKNKYYLNGFLMKAEKGTKIGCFNDYIYACGNGTSNLSLESQFDPKLIKYGNMLIDMSGYPAEMIEGLFELNGYPKWYAHLPLGILFYKPGHDDTSGGHNQVYVDDHDLNMQSVLKEVLNFSNGERTGVIAVAVGEDGKPKKKGVYKDSDNSYWVVGDGNLFIGRFDTPIKWKKINGVDTPHFKSDFIEYDESGNEKLKTNTFKPFGTKDVNGRTEADFSMSIDEQNCLNYVFGTYSPA